MIGYCSSPIISTKEYIFIMTYILNITKKIKVYHQVHLLAPMNLLNQKTHQVHLLMYGI